MTKFTTAAVLSAVVSLATFSGAFAGEVRDRVNVPSVTASAPVEGRNVAALDGVSANADRAIDNAVRQTRR